jgi:hypothetical protein
MLMGVGAAERAAVGAREAVEEVEVAAAAGVLHAQVVVQPPNTRLRLVATSASAVRTRLRPKHRLESLPEAVLTKRTWEAAAAAW